MVGPTVTAAGFAILASSGGDPSHWSGVLPGLTVVAIGMTITIAPLTTTVFDSAPNEMSGTASGINNAAARTGSLVAIAALVSRSARHRRMSLARRWRARTVLR